MNKITNKQSFCVASATKVLGDKWTPMVLVSLINSAKHFCEIQTEVAGINPRTLSFRLNKLCKIGIIKKTKLLDTDSRDAYQLTQMGEDLFPILKDMVAWGKKYSASKI